VISFKTEQLMLQTGRDSKIEKWREKEGERKTEVEMD
jgi:hypothetical protein